MKCIACEKENVQNARFCAFCGAKLPDEAPATPPEEPTAAHTVRQTARPLSDNPYQPPRSPVIHSARPVETAKPAEAVPEKAEEPARESSGPRQIIKPAPKRVFLFDEEQEEEDARREKEARAAKRREADEFDEFDEFEDDYDEDEDDDIYDEEDEPSGGRIFVRICSVLTVLILIAGVIAFMYGTTIGSRLRASVGMSSKAEDYILLADWQLQQNSLSDASESYYNAFKLRQDDYELALTVGTGFEKCGDETRAEQLYTYLITTYPQADEPYDRLMALLNRQGRTEQYEAMLTYRAEHQPGYTPPTTPAPAAPTASHAGGAYEGSIQLTLEAGGAEIRYTLDGTAPTAESFLYTGPITLTTGTYNLRAVAIENGQISPEWTGSFIVS